MPPFIQAVPFVKKDYISIHIYLLPDPIKWWHDNRLFVYQITVVSRTEEETHHLLHKMQSTQQYWIPKAVTVTVELLTIFVQHRNIGNFIPFFFFFNKIYFENKDATENTELSVDITYISL